MNKILIPIIIILLDQITKVLAKSQNFSIINYVENKGASFGLFQGQTWLFLIAALIVILLIFNYYKKVDKNMKIPLLFILGGTVSNTADRILYGVIRDFIDLGFFPIFNIADIANTIGVILLLYILWKTK